MTKILVIMATYNGEKYIKQQLDSILHQKDVQVYILIRDDGSSDGTVNILRQYSDLPNVEFYVGKHLNVQNGYYELMTNALNYNSDYIAFSDQDDVWDEDKLAIAVKNLNDIDKNTPALYYCGQKLVDSELDLLAEHCLNNKRNLHTRFVMSDFAGCTGVFNRSLLSMVMKYKPQYMLMHDTWILKVCLAVGGKVIVDSGCHMKYRQHGGNTVGLGRSLPAYFKQVKQYIFDYKIEKQMKELVRGYDNVMVPEYKKIAYAICGYRRNKQMKKFLLSRKNVDFCSKGLNATYRLKIFLNKL